MSLKTLEKMPEKQARITVYSELVRAVKEADEGDMFEWQRDDEKKIQLNPTLTAVEKATGKTISMIKIDSYTVAVKVLTKNEITAEKKAREERAREMKKKLEGN